MMSWASSTISCVLVLLASMSKVRMFADAVSYFQGIIDILTPYTLVKRFEHFIKGIKNDKVSRINLCSHGPRNQFPVLT